MKKNNKKSPLKLHILLAKTDVLAAQFKGALKDYIGFFKNKQGAFRGERKTYEANPGTVDEVSRRGNVLVQTTVDEKLEWFTENNSEYINALFSQEKTNSCGIAKAELIVDGESWGEFTSLELLRLKTLLESSDLKGMYGNIPVRSDAEEWNETDAEMYQGRAIFESPKNTYTNKTTIKESYILEDPNVSKTTANYTPQVAQKNIIQELGQGSIQRFSGEWSHRQRAEVLKRISALHLAVVQALKAANDVEVVESEMTAEKLFDYLHQE